ncbi:MAG: tRNA (adenosine(37)-N6)-dimethylallyltransferase MiaA [Deltaproteobacteria bacterium]|nr:tRNA (adenosine(37)-N6)-dimethylallyltransferase MiaA [Deltaproteobacteria bacterium]
MPEPGLFILAGPTAVGKTGLAIRLAQEFSAEIVGADSVQVYRGLDLGSAKPTPAEQAQARHHLIDVADPAAGFSAARFAELAAAAVAEITARGRRVIVAGGTGLYLRALVYGLAPAPPGDPALRERLARDWDQEGATALHARLAEQDPGAAARLHPNDRQRVLRALEVALLTGRPLSAWQAAHGFREPRYPHVMVGLARPRAELLERIAQRAREMFDQGLVEEVAGLLARGVPPDAPGLATLGYRQAVALLEGRLAREAAVADTIAATGAYAKRQMTWFRAVPGIHWHHPADYPGILARARAWWPGAGGAAG